MKTDVLKKFLTIFIFKPCLPLPGTNPYCPKCFKQVIGAVHIQHAASTAPNMSLGFARMRNLPRTKLSWIRKLQSLP